MTRAQANNVKVGDKVYKVVSGEMQETTIVKIEYLPDGRRQRIIGNRYKFGIGLRDSELTRAKAKASKVKQLQDEIVKSQTYLAIVQAISV